jgi:MFS family permease
VRPETSDAKPVEPVAMRRVASAALVGTVIEFYDFLIYGTAAALVFPQVFFPALGPAAGTVASFAAVGVAFIVRPLGSVLFGHFGDRLGRKKTLITTLLLMGSATILIGLMPTAAQIGIAAPIGVLILRVLQGIAAGGEWAGAVLVGSEHAPKARRGFWSMFPSLGASFALSLANATFMATGLTMSPEAFTAWGWRVPFLTSFALIGVGLYVRLKIDETPVFKSQARREGASRVPFLEVFTRQPRQVLLGGGATLTTFALTYTGASYLTNYGTAVLQLPRTSVLAVGTGGGIALAAGIVLGGAVSDRIGRRPVIILGSLIGALWTSVLFPILDIGSVSAFAIGLLLTMVISGFALGPLGAFLSEMFPTRYRYTGAGLSYNLGAAIGGAVPPLVGAAITAAVGRNVFGLFLAAICLLSALCTFALAETREHDLETA